MSLTFVQLQNAVLADAFPESRRADAKTWIQARHAWLWDLEEWSFRLGTDAVTFASDSQVVTSMPTDFRIALALYDANGSPVSAVKDPRKFFDTYNTAARTGTGPPEAFTVIGDAIYVGPKGDGTSGTLVYEKAPPALTDNGDTTGLPGAYDLALVHGAKSEGFKLSNVPLADAFDADFQAHIKALQRGYLTSIRGQNSQFGAYRPGR